MIRHVVLFKFHDGVDYGDPRFLRAEAEIHDLPNHVPEILQWECGRNVAERNIAYDYAAIGGFEDRDAVEAYLYHPVHVRGVDSWREFSTWVMADFETPPQ
ncbi:Dabb family protein [Streptomyces sp. NPDC055663]